jgi:hypothetical protein
VSCLEVNTTKLRKTLPRTAANDHAEWQCTAEPCDEHSVGAYLSPQADGIRGQKKGVTRADAKHVRASVMRCGKYSIRRQVRKGKAGCYVDCDGNTVS